MHIHTEICTGKCKSVLNLPDFAFLCQLGRPEALWQIKTGNGHLDRSKIDHLRNDLLNKSVSTPPFPALNGGYNLPKMFSAITCTLQCVLIFLVLSTGCSNTMSFVTPGNSPCCYWASLLPETMACHRNSTSTFACQKASRAIGIRSCTETARVGYSLAFFLKGETV